jgi:hypothetical protein
MGLGLAFPDTQKRGGQIYINILGEVREIFEDFMLC